MDTQLKIVNNQENAHIVIAPNIWLNNVPHILLIKIIKFVIIASKEDIMQINVWKPKNVLFVEDQVIL